MAPKQSDDSFTEQEAARRLETILKGAFKGPPTPLKAVPTRAGDERRLSRKPAKASATSTKRAKDGRSAKRNQA